jgi:spermidine synthase
MRLQALLPLLIHAGQPRSALVIGLGTGITAGALSRFPGLEHRVVAELLPAVARAVPAFQGNFSAATDAGLKIRLRDGRRELRRSDQRYDLITLEPPPPSAASVVNLYSSDFYTLAKSRLQPNGMVAQWLPLPTQNDEDTRALVRSFIDVFPHASLWTTELHEMLLVGSPEAMALDVGRITDNFSDPEVTAALQEVGIASPAALLATWVSDRTGLAAYAGDAPAVTDDDPQIEYAAWLRPGEFARVLPRLMALFSEPPLIGASEEFRRAMAWERENLFIFYGAGLYAYTGQQEHWALAMARVTEADPQNPYFNWFADGAPNANPQDQLR